MFFEKIRPDMKKICQWSCEAAQELVEGRKNSHELFGYDFMVDENFNTWLIEINSSPAMDYSTVRTEICQHDSSISSRSPRDWSRAFSQMCARS